MFIAYLAFEVTSMLCFFMATLIHQTISDEPLNWGAAYWNGCKITGVLAVLTSEIAIGLVFETPKVSLQNESLDSSCKRIIPVSFVVGLATSVAITSLYYCCGIIDGEYVFFVLVAGSWLLHLGGLILSLMVLVSLRDKLDVRDPQVEDAQQA